MIMTLFRSLAILVTFRRCSGATNQLRFGRRSIEQAGLLLVVLSFSIQIISIIEALASAGICACSYWPAFADRSRIDQGQQVAQNRVIQLQGALDLGDVCRSQVEV